MNYELKLKKLYKNNTACQMAKIFGFTESKINHDLQKFGLNNKIRLYKIEKTHLIILINKGLNINQIAKKIGCDRKNISYHLKKHNLHLLPKVYQPKANKDYYEKEYCIGDKSISGIQIELGCSRQKILSDLKYYELVVKSISKIIGQRHPKKIKYKKPICVYPIQFINDEYLSGKSFEHISKLVCCSRSKVTQIIRSHNIKRPTFSDEEIINLYNELGSIKKTGKELGISKERIRATIPKLKPKYTDLLYNKKWLINQYEIQQKSYPQIAEELGCSIRSVARLIHKHEIEPDLSRTTSRFENEIVKEITLFYGGNVIKNHKIDGQELDIWIPEHNFGIEFNGSYWHSELYKKRNKHRDKFLFFSNLGIRLIQIWEHDWINDSFRNKIMSIIESTIVGPSNTIYARKCDIILLTNNTKELKFNNRTHLQNHATSTVCFGLYYNDKLMSLMSFTNRSKHWELTRYTKDHNYNIVGGVEKLFKHFVINYLDKQLISYSSCDYFTGSLYKKLGFQLDSHTDAGYVYVNPNNFSTLSRQQCQKHKLIKQGFDKNKTGHQIMLDRGYLRCFNSGNYKWIYEINKTNVI